MIKGFKDFISRGNVVDLAVGVVIGAAFGKIVDALVDGIINPLIAGVIGKPDFSDVLAFTIGNSTVKPGLLITAVVNFLLMAFAIYLCIVVPMNKLAALRTAKEKADKDAAPKVSDEVQLLTEIRDALKSSGSTTV
ncbi:large conductance mechanosensitive channel protein MscL [Schaalia georgiae]|nr:large conductance mechanosensitive channel protein MscL [Schaalia georgiae]